MPGENKQQDEKKKRNGYSFSIKKTDSPIIKNFLENQGNYSESLRYLIMKHCMENGVGNISDKLNELIYSQVYSNMNNNDLDKIKQFNIGNSEEKVTEKKILDNKLENKKLEKIKDSVEEEKLNNDLNSELEDDDDLPDCYK